MDRFITLTQCLIEILACELHNMATKCGRQVKNSLQKVISELVSLVTKKNEGFRRGFAFISRADQAMQ